MESCGDGSWEQLIRWYTKDLDKPVKEIESNIMLTLTL